MGTILTQDEFNLLNLLLPKIPIKETFSINALHATYILKPLYPRGDGAIDLAKYDAARKDFTDRGVYLHITAYLIEQNFANPTGKTVPFTDLKLTEVGVTVRAYGDAEKYFNAFSKTMKREIELRVPNLLERISPYGEFTITYNLPRTIVFNAADFIGLSDEDAFKMRDDRLEQKEELIFIHEQRVKDEETLQYLVDEGFATNRHDINSPDRLYRQLTDEGRKLKKLGNIDAYNSGVKSEQDKIDRIEKDNDVLRQTNIISGSITKRLYYVNLAIAGAGIIAALYYLVLTVDYFSNLMLKHLPLYYGIATTLYLLLLGILLGVGLLLSIQRLNKIIKKKKTKL